MAQGTATDAVYQLPTPVGNSGPFTDLSQVVNSNGQTVQRQRMETYIGGMTATIGTGVSKTVSQKQGGCISFLVTVSAGAADLTFWDNQSGPAGVQVGVVPAGAAKGSRWVFEMPVEVGIWAQAPVGCAGGTLCYQQ